MTGHHARAVLAPAIAGWLMVNAPAHAGEHPVWTEVAWPFLIDQWGTGRAFRCASVDCGTRVDIYLRAKIGFCNCATGVADDEEIDRVGDLDLLGGPYRPIGEGRSVSVGTMKGRERAFAIEPRFGAPRSALAVALASRCDAVVATVVTDGDVSNVAQDALAFLNSEPVLRWAEASTGLQ